MALKKAGSKDELKQIADTLWGLKSDDVRVFSDDLNKTASIDKESSYDVQYAQSQFYSPRLTPDTWYLPRTRKMLLKWVDIFFDWDPYVNSILSMHARYPISDFNLVCEQKIKEHFDYILHNEKWDILDVIREGSLSFKKFGEAFCLAEWDSEEGYWKNFTWLDPGLIEVEEVPFTNKIKIFSEIPTKYIKMMKSTKAIDIEKQKSIPDIIKKAIAAGKKYIELDNEETMDANGNYSPSKICCLVNKGNVGEKGLRGLPPITPLLKDLVMGDYLRKAQMARAQRFAYPIEIWKLGDVSQNILPDDQALKDVQSMLRDALASPPYTIVYSPLLSLEVVGAAGSLLPIYDDYAFIENRILVGLGTNKNIVLGEGGWMSNAKTLSMQRLIMDYQVDRDMWTRKFLQNFILRPMCLFHGYVKEDPITGRETPNIPKISWVKSLDIQNEEDTKKLYVDMWEKGLISTKTLFSKFPDLEFENEMRAIEQEKGTIIDGGSNGRTLPSVIKTLLPGGTEKKTPEVAGIGESTHTKPSAPPKPEAM
jgi:hypothetical protein